MTSGSLLKGNGLYSKPMPSKLEKPPLIAPPHNKKLPAPATKEEMIVIHVCDEK